LNELLQELLSLFGEDESIRLDMTLTYGILGVWSLSVMQFTLTFTVGYRPLKERGVRVVPMEEDHKQSKR
jgi:hypothetical protein